MSFRSLTTIASPHRGSAFADYVFDRIGRKPTAATHDQRSTHCFVARLLPQFYGALRALQIETGAFSQLTRRYMREEFNPRTPDREGVRYTRAIFSFHLCINRPPVV